MKRAAQHPPSVRRKVQYVSCPCCEARLALHFVHGEDEVFNVELLGLSPAPEETKGGSSGLAEIVDDGKNKICSERGTAGEEVADVVKIEVCGALDTPTELADDMHIEVPESEMAVEVMAACEETHDVIEVDPQVETQELELSSPEKVIEKVDVSLKEDSCTSGLPPSQLRETACLSESAPLTALKTRKGKNFVPDEEIQLCRSYLSVSQNPVPENGQKNQAFWERVQNHYNQNRPSGVAERPARSLESKWGVIKHDVGMFLGHTEDAAKICKLGASSEDILQKALELYKTKHPKNSAFVFIHCWLFLKDVPRWADSREDQMRKTISLERQREDQMRKFISMEKQREEMKKVNPMMERKFSNPSVPASEIDVGELQVIDQAAFASMTTPKQHPVGGQQRPTKEDQMSAKVREGALRAQARATADMAAATLKRARILQDQTSMALFTITDDQLLSEEAKEYFKLRRNEELVKLRARMQQEY